MMISAAETTGLRYDFENDLAGFAEGRISLTAGESGDYHLYFADENGALEGYDEIAFLSLEKGETASVSFKQNTVIPRGAKYVIASFEDDPDKANVKTSQAVYSIPQNKRLSENTVKQYSFAALSDAHIDLQDGGTNVYYENASKNLTLALERCYERQADFVIMAGDQITNASGEALEWLEYQRILSESEYENPVYESVGNHETRYSKYAECDVSCGLEAFITATGLDGSGDTISSGKTYFEITEKSTGDHFIFMSLENGVSTNEIDNFSDEQMDWVEGLLKRYANDGHKIFLIQHSPITNYGAGDDRDDPGYGGAIRLSDENGAPFVNNRRFKSLIEEYRDIIWLSGHTHIDFRDDVNFSSQDGSSCSMLHIPSVANTTRLSYDKDGNRTLDRTFYEDTTQGYFVDVYDGYTVFSGTNFYNGRVYPLYSYIVGEERDVPLSTEEPTQEAASPDVTEIPFVLGDADMDAVLTILDATAIQRHLASLLCLNDEQIKRAMVCDGRDLSVIDATCIQKKLASLIDHFPIENIAPSGASDLQKKAKGMLDGFFQYASYSEYQALKKAYHEGGDLSAALSAFEKLREQVKITTVYFTDSEKTGNVHAYLWNSKTGKAVESWPGQKPAWVKTNSLGQEVYAVTIDLKKFDRAVFCDGKDRKTADIVLDDKSGRVYYPISHESPYDVTSGVFKKMWYADPDSSVTVYFTNTQDWKNVYLYYWDQNGSNGWPGMKMTYVRSSSSGKGIYKATVPADASVIFTDGESQTADIEAVSDGCGFYPKTKNSDGKWLVVMYRY